MTTGGYSIANPKLVERFVKQHPDKKSALLEALADICDSPIGEPPLKKHLKGQFYCNWRRRLGQDFRIRYTFQTLGRQIRVLEIGPRRDMY